jgi:hypothetical protein
MIALGLGVLAFDAGCKPQAGPGTGPCPTGSGPYKNPEVCLKELSPPCARLCSNTHRVSKDPAPNTGCPVVAESSWTTVERANYCTYEWTDPSSDPDMGALDVALDDTGIDTIPDCMVYSTQSASPNVLEPFFQTRTDEVQYGKIELPSLPSGTFPAPVMVAVVDTAPPQGYKGNDDLFPNGTVAEGSQHGLAMASIVRDIKCGGTTTPDPYCLVTVETFLGLPRRLLPTGKEEINKNGGYYGYHTDLAAGIREALKAFETWKAVPGNEDAKLVVNLSVGWECDPEPGQDPGSVLDAITKATDAGALVVAAAGNRKPGTCVDGPMAPGDWGTKAISGINSGMNVPSLYAVTPVDDDLQDLGTFRPSSNTRIAARGFMVVTHDETVVGGRYFGPYSGSSVSTAVTSGIAALVWSYYPDHTPDALMQKLWESGQTRNPAVEAMSYYDYSGTRAAPEQHVISACSALGYFECPGPNPCPPPGCTEPAAGDSVTDALNSVWSNSNPSPIVTGCMDTVLCDSCGSSTTTVTTAKPNEPVQGSDTMWVVPQPSDPPCTACTLTLNSPVNGSNPKSSAYLILDNTYTAGSPLTYPLVNTKITVTNSQGTEEYNYTNLDLSLQPSGSVTIDDDAFGEVGVGYPTTNATVAMTFTDNGVPFTVSNTLTLR